MANTDRKLVNLQVTDEQKTRWNKYVNDSPEHKSLSQFIRFVVEREIKGEGTPVGPGASPGTDDARLTELREDNRQLRAKLDGVAETVERIENRLEEPAEDIRKLASEIFDVLPERDLVVDSDGNPQLSHGFGLPNETKAYEGTVKNVANILDTDEYRTLKALDLLERDMSMVTKGTVYEDGIVRYYRDEAYYGEQP